MPNVATVLSFAVNRQLRGKEKKRMRLYIDPGTGSMLFTILVGLLGTGIFAFRKLFLKLRFYFSGGKQKKGNQQKQPIAIFSDSKRYWNVFESVCDELERRGHEAVYLTASEDDPALEKPYEHIRCEFIGSGNKGFAKLNMLKADVVLSTTPGLDVYQWKRSRDVKWYVHVPHASSDIVLYRMFGIDYYDAVLLSGTYQVNQIRELESLRGLKEKELPIVGMTYMDAMKARLDNAEALLAHPRTVLLAPSWGQSAILMRYGARIIDALLKTGYHIIIRPHPQSFTSETELIEGLMQKYPDSEQLEWNRDNDNFDVLRRADILISDFSGVIFDFALVFDKPIIYADTAFDKSPYDACWIQEELWTFSTLPKIGEQLTEEKLDSLKELIDRCLSEPKRQEARDRAREETWQYPGEAAKRVVDYLIAKQEEILKKEADQDGEKVKNAKTK